MVRDYDFVNGRYFKKLSLDTGAKSGSQLMS